MEHPIINFSLKITNQLPITIIATKLAGLYLSATELRSVLLATLLAERQISVEEAFVCSFAEEIEEQNKWGIPEEIEQRHATVRARLKDAEKMINA